VNIRRAIVIGVLSIAILLTVVVLAGLAISRTHRASRTTTLAAPPEGVFAVVSDFIRYPEWRSDVKSMVVDGQGGVGTMVYEEGPHGPIPYRVEAHEPPSRLVLRIADPALPFSGTWTYELRPSGSGTELTLTEDGEVANPIFRVMQKLFFSPYDTIDTYLDDLVKRLR
jgi:uncharacterized protein YndB with AHSA1/START domain